MLQIIYLEALDIPQKLGCQRCDLSTCANTHPSYHQLPPSLTLNPKRRVIEKYKRALFSRHIGSINLKNEIKKLMEASKDMVDLSFSAGGGKPLPSLYQGTNGRVFDMF